MNDSTVEAALAGVGRRLRDLRNRRNLRLSDVAESTGMSVSTLSRLESGQRRPSLDLLLPLARVYHVPLDDLVGAPYTGDPRVHLKPVRRGEIVYIPLTRQNIGVQAVKMIFPGRAAPKPLTQRTHDGYEWLYVLVGDIHLKLDDTLMTLRSGEVAEFDTRRPHAMASAGPETAEVLALFSPQGERIHLQGLPEDDPAR